MTAPDELLPVTPDFSRATLQANIESILRNSRDVHAHSLARMIMDAIPRAAPQSDSDVVAALQALFDDYKELADSGDAGFWSLEDTPVGKQALAALENARHRLSHCHPGDGMREALQLARDRLADMLMGDDGQAWKEAEKAPPIIDAALTHSALSGDAGEGETLREALAKRTSMSTIAGGGQRPHVEIRFANLADAHALTDAILNRSNREDEHGPRA